MSDSLGARDLLVRLVRTPSVSGDEAACAQELAGFLRRHDREVWLDDAGNVRAPGDDGVLLTSHVDTVPGEIPVRVETDDRGRDVLWGRGSVDAKGALAAMATAAVETGASFAGVVGEEVDSQGSRHLVATRERVPEVVINGEPSGWNGFTLGYRGLLRGTYVCTSASGHSSRPDNNPIQDAMNWWHRVEAVFDHDDRPVFERVTPTPVSIEGGRSTDGLSVEARIELQLRVPPGRTIETVRDRVDDCLDTGTVNWHDRVEPVMESPRTAIARAFRAAIRASGGEPRMLRKTGTSDMNVFASGWDVPVVSYGPGDSTHDHAPDERVPLPEYDKSVGVLVDVTERLL